MEAQAGRISQQILAPSRTSRWGCKLSGSKELRPWDRSSALRCSALFRLCG